MSQIHTKYNSTDDFKTNLLRNGLLPQYIRRINNLEKIEQELWIRKETEQDPTRIFQILIELVNLQSITSNCYVAAKHELESEMELNR